MWSELEKFIESSEFYSSLSKVLELLSQATSATRCNFWLIEGHHLVPIFNYDAEKGDYILDQLKSLDLNQIPRYYQNLLKKGILFLEDVHKSRASSELSEIYWKPFDISSSVDFILRYRGQVLGVICVEFKNRKSFSEEERKQLKKIKKLLEKSYGKTIRLEEFNHKTLLREAIISSDISVVITNRSGLIRFVNNAFEKMTGYSAFEVVGRKTSILKSGYHTKEFYRDLWKTVLSGKIWRGLIINRKKNGEIYYERKTIVPIFKRKELVGFLSLGYDATEEIMLQRVKLISEEISRIVGLYEDEAELFEKVCHLLKSTEEYDLIWVGKRVGNYVNIVYGVGRTEYLKNMQVSLEEGNPLSKSPTSKAFLTGETVVFNDLESVPEHLPWMEKALSFGFRSTLSVPIKVKGDIEYTLNIYSPEKNYFTEDRVKIIEYVANEIGLTIERLRLREEIQKKELYDALTGLPNRKLLLEELDYSVKLAKEYGKKLFLLMLDIINFSLVNASYGFGVGDRVLIALVRKLKETFPEAHIIGRIGADDFCVVGFFDKYLERIIQRVESLEEIEIVLEDLKVSLYTTMALVLYPKDAQDGRSLFEKAVLTLKRCQKAGKPCYCMYDSSVEEEFQKLTELQQDIHHALEEGEFLLYYQPIVDLKTLKVKGAEALIRWHSKKRGFVSPGLFIPVAESTGLIREIDNFVLKKAQEFIHRIKGLVSDDFKVCVNLTPSNFDLLEKFLYDEYFIKHLDVELIEREFFDIFKYQAILHRFIELGGTLSIDDFGTGYSSLSYLADLPAHSLKIDMSFVRRLEVDEKTRKLVYAIVEISRTFGMKTIAEGVETQGQYEILKNLGCNCFQGYYFSPPVSEDVFVEKFLS
ncbi:MAG: EAL domain-containing protein [Thermodesulfobacterium sp.]|nr:EAL domain-containing protein [Thermodesulfobacterium sp.]